MVNRGAGAVCSVHSVASSSILTGAGLAAIMVQDLRDYLQLSDRCCLNDDERL